MILVAEIIAIRIRTNTGIKGIKYKELEIKISLMADDTTMFVTDLQSLEKAIEEFKKFQKCSGLKLNIEKNEIIPLLGTLRNKLNKTHLPQSLMNIQIKEGPFKALGVWFSNDEKEITDLNYTERLCTMQKMINIWSARNLSLRGKIMIIKALILPQIQFLFAIIYTPDNL